MCHFHYHAYKYCNIVFYGVYLSAFSILNEKGTSIVYSHFWELLRWSYYSEWCSLPPTRIILSWSMYGNNFATERWVILSPEETMNVRRSWSKCCCCINKTTMYEDCTSLEWCRNPFCETGLWVWVIIRLIKAITRWSLVNDENIWSPSKLIRATIDKRKIQKAKHHLWVHYGYINVSW